VTRPVATPLQPSIQGRVPPTRPDEGRAQERGDRTRSAIIDETIRCVLDEGFAAASAKHIAERAGVTWGVIQYHFGDRGGLLGAVVASGYESFRQSIESLDIPDGTARERVATIVDAAWSAFSRPVSRASLEITVATRTTRARTQHTELAAMARTLHQLGERIVGDQPDQRALGRLIGDVLWATLRGLVVVEMVAGEPLDFTRERAMLCDLIAAYLQTGSSR
jgi:AcrR family transcriptional regulator